MLIATRTVLHRVDDEAERRFEAIDEETDVVCRSLYLDIDTYTDLGCPDTVTITVMPGDALNQPGMAILTHVIPTGDVIDHDPTDDCVCGPTSTLNASDADTPDTWVVRHHRLGREQQQ